MRQDNLTTLCYIIKGEPPYEEVLFMCRNRRKNDINSGKWLGIGGHFEKNESPQECIVREIHEETGLTFADLSDIRERGIITFVSDNEYCEYMHVFTAHLTSNKNPCPGNCDEGELEWINSADIETLPLWEGDLIMFDCLKRPSFFDLKLFYENNKLMSHILYVNENR